MFESFDVAGQFWLPNEPDRDCWGILKQRPGDGVRLELYDPPPHLCELSGIRVEVLHGKLANGASCSLFGCSGIVKTYGIEEEHHRALIDVHRMIDGGHFRSPNECHLVKLSCQFTHLNEWFDDPYDIEAKNGLKEFEVRFTPEDFHADLEFEGVKFRAEFKCSRSLPSICSGGVTGFSHQYYIRLSTLDPHPLPWFLSVASILRECMIFLIGYGIYTLDLGATFPSADMSETESEPCLGRIFQSVDIPSALMGDIHYFSTRYENIKGNLANVLQAWFSSHQEMKLVTKGYSSILLNDGAYVESMFLSIVQILEHLHGVIFRDESKYMPTEYWKKFRDRLAAHSAPILIELFECTEGEIRELAEVIMKSISSNNELTFRSRLTQLFKKIPPPCLVYLLGNPDSLEEAAESFLRKVDDTRNFLTHHEKSKAKKALYGRDLRDAILSCWAVLTFWIARKLGFSEEEADTIASNARGAMFLASREAEL